MNLHDLLLRVRTLAAPRSVERALNEELAFHLERDAQRHIANGLSPEDARARGGRASVRWRSPPTSAVTPAALGSSMT